MNELKEKIIELEQYCLRADVRKSLEKLDKILHDDFLEIPSTGIPYNKTDALKNIPNQVLPEFIQQDYELRILSENLVQLVYKASIQKVNDDNILYSARSSIWKQESGQWKMLFHQGTPCKAFKIKS